MVRLVAGQCGQHGFRSPPTIRSQQERIFAQVFADQQSAAALTKHILLLFHTSAYRPQASHAERIVVDAGPIGKVRVAVVPFFGAEVKSKRPFKTFIRSRIVRRPIFEERALPVPGGCGPCEAARSKPLSSRTTI